MLNWARIFEPFTFTIDTLFVHVKTRFGRRWDSNIYERMYEREFMARGAFNELQIRLPTAR